MNYPARPKRTIRDISHHFLSQVPSVSTVKHKPIIGCYLAKGVTKIEQVVQQILESSPGEGRPTQVYNLNNTHLASLLPKSFPSIRLDPDKFRADGMQADSSDATSTSTVASAYYFVFREDDCLVMDSAVSAMGSLILVGDSSGEDLTELYKVVKGFHKLISVNRWFLCFYPELSVASTRLAIQQLNKITRAFLNVEVAGWHSGDPESLRIWRDPNLQLDEETTSRQNAFYSFINQQASANGYFPQSDRS